MFLQPKIATFLFGGTFFLGGCGKLFLESTSTTKDSGFTLDANSPLNNLKERCGFSLEETTDPKKPFVDMRFKSLPIVTDGKFQDIEFKVSVTASTRMTSGARGSKTEISSQIAAIEAKTGTEPLNQKAIDLYIRPKAALQVGKNSGSVMGAPVAVTTILNLKNGEGPYKGIFCSLGLSGGSKDLTGGDQGETVFSPPAPMAINPLAAMATYASELGEGRSIATTVTIIKSKSGWEPIGAKATINFVIKKISPDISMSSGLKDVKFPVMKSDLADEVVATGPQGKTLAAFGIKQRLVFYLDTTARKLRGLIIVSDQIDPGMSTPPIVLIRED